MISSSFLKRIFTQNNMITKVLVLIASLFVRLFVFRKEKKIILCPSGIGDTVFTLLFAEDLAEKYRGSYKKIVYICKKSHFDVFRVFNVHNVLANNFLNKVLGFYCRKRLIYENKWILYAGYLGKNKPQYLNGKYAINDFHDTLLSIENPIKYKYPVIPIEITQKIHDYGVNKKSIIISPYATTAHNLTERFWNKVVDTIKKQGYTIYTNVSRYQKALDGTKRLDANLFDSFYILSLAKCFIGFRSGMCDFIALSDVHLYIIAPPSWSSEKWDINGFSKNCTVTMKYLEQDEDEIISNLNDYISNI